MTDAGPLVPPVTMPGEPSVARPDAPRLTREVFDHREQRAAFGYDNVDGLPRPVAETASADTVVLPLHPDTFICMGDYGGFYLRIERDDAVLAEFRPEEVQRLGPARFAVPYDLAVQRVGADRQHLVAMSRLAQGRVEVEPRRRPCRHYVRQLTDFEGRRRAFVARMCTALRDESGEYQSLRDTGMYACELRDPPEGGGTIELDAFDARKIAEGALREESGVGQFFDVDAALAKQEPPGLLVGVWSPRDALPRDDTRLYALAGLLITERDGLTLALCLLRDALDQPWYVMGQAEVSQCGYSRHWPRIEPSDEYLFLPRKAVDSDTNLFGPVDGHHTVYRVKLAEVQCSRDSAVEMFGPDIAAHIRHNQVVRLTVEREELELP